MKKLLSVLVAGMFAFVSVQAFAASHAGGAMKDVTTKEGTAKAKDGTNVTTKDAKEKPKGGPLPKVKGKPKKEMPSTAEVKTKEGAVKSADKKDVKAAK